jgi:O-antigen/teichoic acid export membrane protein
LKAAFIWSFLGQYSNFIIQIVSVVVLARLLTPTELGTFAICAALLSLAQTFKDLGVTQYLVREKSLSLEKKQGVLFFSWFSCILLALVLVLIAKPIGDFYDNSQLTGMIPLLAVNILITPLSILNLAQIKKEMRFKLIAFIGAFSAAFNSAVAISLAYMDYGPYSLVFASICSTLCTLVLVNHYSSEKFVLPKPTALKEVLRGMSFIAGVNVLNVMSNQGQPLLIGKFLSEAAIAILDKAGALVKMLESSVFTGIQNVLLPLFSQLKNEKKDGSYIYADIVAISVAISWPFLFYLGYHADFLILLFFGEQWVESAPLVPFICMTAAMFSFGRNFGIYMLSNDKDKTVFRISSCLLILRILVIISVLQYGLLALTQAFVVLSVISLVVTNVSLINSKMIKASQLVRVLLGGIIVFLFSLIPLVIMYLLGWAATEVSFMIILFIAVAPCWVLGLYITKNKVLSEFIIILSNMRAKFS